MARQPIPQLPPAAKKMFQNMARPTGVASTRPIIDRMGPIPVHNSGAGRSNFPMGDNTGGR